MRKLKGFTLAEVLITLAVIGVIAGLTLPSLMINIQKQQVPPALGKAINTIKNANVLAIQQHNVRCLDEIIPDSTSNYFDTAIAGQINWRKVAGSSYYKQYDQTSNVAGTNTASRYHSKDGMTYLRPDATLKKLSKTSHLSPAYSGKYYVVHVDINGESKKPNILGKDLFVLIIDTKGAVIPYGGNAYKLYTNGSSVLWESQCNKTKVTDGQACAGSIWDNAEKVIYY